jgi:hypothetical protein
MARQDIQHYCGVLITTDYGESVACHVGHKSDSWMKVVLCPKPDSSRLTALGGSVHDISRSWLKKDGICY